MKITTYWKRDKQGRFDSFKEKVHRFVRNLIQGAFVFAVLALVFTIGAATYSTSRVEAQFNTVQLAVESPVLDRIADCESGNGTSGSANHYDKNGQVLLRGNKNGTVDVGAYQINSVWFKKATSLGLDITKEADNKTFAEWLYLNKGTGDWSASAKCWQI